MSKGVIYIGAGVGGVIGGALGGLLDHGNYFGVWGIILSTFGGLVGIWAAYRLQK